MRVRVRVRVRVLDRPKAGGLFNYAGHLYFSTSLQVSKSCLQLVGALPPAKVKVVHDTCFKHIKVYEIRGIRVGAQALRRLSANSGDAPYSRGTATRGEPNEFYFLIFDFRSILLCTFSKKQCNTQATPQCVFTIYVRVC